MCARYGHRVDFGRLVIYARYHILETLGSSQPASRLGLSCRSSSVRFPALLQQLSTCFYPNIHIHIHISRTQIAKMDRSLDEIVAESQVVQQRKRGSQPRRGGGGRNTRDRDSYPRDGVRKSTRDDSRNNDPDQWVHDRFEGSHFRDRRQDSSRRRRSPDLFQESRGTKLKIENVHYELSEDDLHGLFSRIGPVTKLQLIYDRAGRSEGIAYVTYETRNDANAAIREFDGANAKGQPIRLTIMSSAPRRNPFDNARMPGKPLAERITRPRSLSPGGDVDRYVPGGGGGSRSRSPLPRRRGGRRAGARREGGQRAPQEPRGRDGRPKKTQEELDAEMDDYFGGKSGKADGAAAEAAVAPAAQALDDIDMIE
ncbi:RNA-binding domain-containing protein [Xylariomycetidae sp. FL2044]|nr:RNA-binding domain-containing protein [Xylariomycetidae sp. FL2044]